MVCRRRLMQLGCAIVALAFTSASAAAEGWRTYHDPTFRFSIEVPAAPTLDTGAVTPAARGRWAPMLSGSITTAGSDSLLFTATDYSKVQTFSDVDAALESNVAYNLRVADLTLDSETKITVGGATGRDVAAHNADTVVRMRLLFKDGRLYAATGQGSPATGVPADYRRFALSLKPD
jgi:hypothetical protein